MTLEDAELIAAFVVESLEHLSDVENQFLQIESGGENIDVDLVNTVFRAVHSVKGAAGFLGLQTINKLAHSLENVLNKVRNQELVPTSSIVDVMLKSADYLRTLLNDVGNSNSADVSNFTTLLDQIAENKGVPASGITVPAKQVPTMKTPSEPVHVDSEPTSETTDNSFPAERPFVPVFDSVPVAPQVIDAVERTAPAQAAPAATKTEGNNAADLNIRVPVSVLDKLMNLAGELVLSRNQLLQKIESSDRNGLESVASGLDQVTSELQEAIMQTRMQPIGNVFGKFPRIVRDLSAKLNKQCNLIIDGRDVEVDKSIIEAINDPLTHLIRNSVDHGIEPPEVRNAIGKKSQGTITLRAFHQAGKVRIDIRDDGGGINPAIIKEKAVQKGMMTADRAAAMSDREAIRLIFAPGFSTAKQVTDVSGRGVGMDVVRTNIERIGGSVDVESEVGKGTSIRVTLPLTLAIIPSMIVDCHNERYAIPQVNIVELVRIRPDEASTRLGNIKNADVLRLRGSLLPLVHLDVALGFQKGHTAENRNKALSIVVVESGQTRYGLVVDALHDSEEIVVKPMGRHLKNCGYVAGATILGDGHVALILDIAGIASHAELRVADDDGNNKEEIAIASSSENVQTLMVFSNDPREQFAVPMGVVNRIERVRRDQIDTVGGREILQYRHASLPLISIEKAINCRPRPDLDRMFIVVFEVRGKEVGLIAPKLDDIRRVECEIDTTTFHEPAVAGSLVLDGHTIRVLDLYEMARKLSPEWFVDAEEAKPKSVREGKRRILLAEDSSFFQKQVKGFLENAEYEVTAAFDGQEAWEILIEDPTRFDLVLTDVEMPRMNGFEFCAQIRKNPRTKDLPVIALTSLAGSEDIKKGYEVGVNDYQIKMDREKLIESVRNLIVVRIQNVVGKDSKKRNKEVLK